MWRSGGWRRSTEVTVQLPAELTVSLQRLIDRQVHSIELREQQVLEDQRQSAVQRDVVRLVTYAVLLVGYAGALAVVGAPMLVASLFIPDTVTQNAQQFAALLRDGFQTLPDSLKALIVPLVSSAILLALRATSSSIRTNLGGSLLVGVIALTLLGLSSAATTGPFGALAALPGFIVAGAVLARLGDIVRRVSTPQSPGAPVAAVDAHPDRAVNDESMALRRGGTLLSAAARIGRFAHGRLTPARKPVATGAFVALPLSASAVVALLVTSGPHPPLGLVAIAALAVWTVWAIVVTPVPLRIPYWSSVVWSVGMLFLLAFTATTLLFAASVIAVLVANITVAAWRWQEPPGSRSPDHPSA